MPAAWIILAGVASLPAQAAPAPRPDWAEIVPADVGLLVEFRDLSVLRHYLRRAGVWDTIRRIGEAEAGRFAATQPWQQRTEALLGMTSDEVILRLLGVRTALIAASPVAWPAGLVLAEMGGEDLIPPLLARWKAAALDPIGPARRFRLPSGLLVAQRGRTLLFGPEADPQGLWIRTVVLMAGRGGPNLAGDADYRELRSALPHDFHGLCYAVWPSATPAPVGAGAPPAPANRRVAAALDVDAAGAILEVHGRDPAGTWPAAPVSNDLAGRLPRDALLTWCGTLDLGACLAAQRDQPAGRTASPLAFLARAVFVHAPGGEAAVKSLGDSLALIVGRLPADFADDFDQPVATLVLQTNRPQEAMAAFDGVLQFARYWLSAISRDPQAAALALEPRPSTEAGVEIRSMSIGHALAARTRCPFFQRLELAGAADQHWLLLSTSSRHLLQVARGLQAEPAHDRAADDAGDPGPAATALRMRGAPLAQMLKTWLTYLEHHRPEALEARFWADWAEARLEQQRRLGLGLRDSRTRPHQADVVEVARGSPAAGLVRPGDVVLGAAGRRLTTTQPAREVAEAFARAAPDRPFTLSIRRNRATVEVAIPLNPVVWDRAPDFDPVAMLRNVIALTEHVEEIRYVRRPSRPDRFDARVRVRWGSPGAKGAG